MDGLARRPREVLGEAGDTGLLPDEAFRGGVARSTGGWENFRGFGDDPLGGSFSCRSHLAPHSENQGEIFTLIPDGFCGGSESRTSLLSRVAKGSIPSDPSIVCSLAISIASSRSVCWELVCSLRDVTGLEEKPALELRSGTGCVGDWDELGVACPCGWPYETGACIAAKYAGLG